MNVEIFITSKFSGRVTNGSGAYGIVLRVKGRPETAKCHVSGRCNLSYQKLNAYAAVEALAYMTSSARVTIYLNNAYADHMIQKGTAEGNAYKELWNIFFEKACSMQRVNTMRVVNHEYTDFLKKKINEGNYPVFDEKEISDEKHHAGQLG